METIRESDVERVYNLILRNVAEPLVGTSSTYGSKLDNACKHLFGSRFNGVYASDEVPRLTSSSPYAIANLDNHTQPGSHWVALAYNQTTKKVHYYDSFGRKYKNTLGANGGARQPVRDTDDDAEQTPQEYNCGARCIAYLCMVEHWGADIASLV